jgi:hypothetical protein
MTSSKTELVLFSKICGIRRKKSQPILARAAITVMRF